MTTKQADQIIKRGLAVNLQFGHAAITSICHLVRRERSKVYTTSGAVYELRSIELVPMNQPIIPTATV